MRNKIVSALLCAVMALGCLTACDAESAKKIAELAKNTDVSGLESVEKEIVSSVTGAGEVPTKDRSGNDIKVPAEVKSIVSLAPSTTRVLIDLGLALKIVAVDTNSLQYKDYLPSGVKSFDMMNPDNEAIAALKPDIVFTSGMSSVGGSSPFKPLVDSGICVADIPSSASLSAIEDDIKFIGNCTGKGISVEDAIAMNPDVILTNVDYVEDPVKDIKALKGWENVKAIKNNEVYKVDPNLSMQPNNHVTDAALEWLKVVYPDIFTELSKSLEQSLKEAVEKIKSIAGSETTKEAA